MMSHKEIFCFNGGKECGCAGHCPFWGSQENNTDEDLDNLLYMRGYNRNKQ